MSKAGNLLPWVMGALMIAAVAVAIAVSSTNREVPALPVLREMAAPPQPAETPTSTPGPAPGPVPTTVPAMTSVPAAQIQTGALPAVSRGQIWECTIGGVKTFSGKPCGDKSLLREISPVNAMDPTPALPYGRSEPDPRSAPEYSYPEDPQILDPPPPQVVHSYPVFIGIPVRERKRPDHAHRPVPGHYRTPPPPKN